MGWEQQHSRWHAAVSFPLLCGEGGYGCARCQLRRGVESLGVETSIIVPGAFTSGTNHFAHAGAPADKVRQAEYDNGPYAHLGDYIMKGFVATAPADADVANAIVNVVDLPFGKRPFRVHIDPAQDGAEIVNGVADRVRSEMYRNIGLSDLLAPVAFSL
jgi:hypothetical protein